MHHNIKSVQTFYKAWSWHFGHLNVGENELFVRGFLQTAKKSLNFKECGENIHCNL